MEPIEITVDGITYIAMPQADGSFDVLRGGVLLGKIFADVNINMRVDWSTADLINQELVQKIGEAIERREL